jgi:hypothetical protein
MGAIEPLARGPPGELGASRGSGERIACIEQRLRVHAIVNGADSCHGKVPLRVSTFSTIEDELSMGPFPYDLHHFVSVGVPTKQWLTIPVVRR